MTFCKKHILLTPEQRKRIDEIIAEARAAMINRIARQQSEARST